METSLFAATPLFERFFNDSPVGMVITTTTDGRYADVNPAFARMLGYAREELIGRPFEVMGFSDPDVRRMVLNVLRNSRKLGDVPLLLEARDGRALTCIASVQLELINGDPYFLLIVQDLTEQEQAQEELRLSEKRFRLFFRSIPLPLLVFDEESLRILDVNPAAGALYGYSADEFPALSLKELMPAEDWEAFRQAAAADPDGAPRTIRRQRLRDGRVIEVEVSSDTVVLDGRRVSLSIIRDVTEQRAIEAELRASQERLRIVADVTTDAIWMRDLTSDQLVWSSGFDVQFGYDESAAPTRGWWHAHVHPDDRAAVEASVEAAFATDETQWASEYRFMRADGVYANVLDRGRIFRDETGRAVRFMGAMVDITEPLQVAEAARRAAQEERQRLARDLHESVTQSLYSLSLMAEAARRRSVEGDEPLSTEYVGRLGELSRQALRQLRLLVYELRPSQLEQVGLAAALRHRLEAVEQRAGLRFRLDNRLTITIPPDLKSEAYRLAQDMLNLSLKNAGATVVTVRLWNEPGRLWLEISDDGRALDAASFGSGLSLLRKRLDALDGTLAVDERDDGGTTLRAGVPTN